MTNVERIQRGRMLSKFLRTDLKCEATQQNCSANQVGQQNFSPFGFLMVLRSYRLKT